MTENTTTFDDRFQTVCKILWRAVERRYDDKVSRQTLHDMFQAGTVRMWQEYTRGKLRLNDPNAHWIRSGLFGAQSEHRRLDLQNGYDSERNGRRPRTFIYAESELRKPQDEQYEYGTLERLTLKHHCQVDPDGGKADMRIDLDLLTEKAFALLNDEDAEDCYALAVDLMAGYRLDEMTQRKGWNVKKRTAVMERLRTVYYQAADLEVPTLAQRREQEVVDRQKVLKLVNEGRSYSTVACMVGCCKQSVFRIVKEDRQARGQQQRTKPEPIDKARVLALVTQGHTYPEVAKLVGCCKSHVGKIVRKAR